MALSRIWSAFIIIAIGVALFRMFGGDEKIFSRMVVGRSDDAYDQVYYRLDGDARASGFTSNEAFAAYIGGYGYVPADSAHPATTIITSDEKQAVVLSSQHPGSKVFTFRSIQSKLTKRADGIIETCKTAVNISIGLIGIMALFMGFMSIAERPAEYVCCRVLSGRSFQGYFQTCQRTIRRWGI